MNIARPLRLRLGGRLALITVAISLVVVPVVSGIYLLQSYRNSVAHLEQQLNDIADSSLPGLREALWVSDMAVVESQLHGLKHYRDMALVELEPAGRPALAVGVRPPDDVPVLVRRLAIKRDYLGQERSLGTLTLVVSLQALRAEVLRDSLFIMAAEALQTALVAGLILVAYQRLAGRRLRSMAGFLERYREGETGGRLPQAGARESDELDLLAAAFNALLDEQERNMTTLEATNVSLALEMKFRTETEQALAAARDAAEAANRELEEFSYSMSHDMRTPLRAIDGFSNILLQEHATGLDVEARRLLGVVRDNARHMGHLIDDILRFLGMGRRRMECGFVDLARQATEILAELQASAPARPLRLETGAMPPAWGDAAMLRLAMRELLSNAMKHSRPEGEVLIEVGGTAEENENSYYVRDHGVGFDMRYADKLFKVFERVHPTGQYEGTGIGLAIVKRIVERHGGRVWAEGAAGEGATFHFALPRKSA